MSSVTVKGLDKAIEKLNSLSQMGLSRALKQSAAVAERRIAKYPPKTIANSPANGYRWYERGFGVKTRTGNDKKTSQTLGRRWTIQINQSTNTAVIGNNADYAPYVQDWEKQARFHAARGWKTNQTVAEEIAEEVLEIFEEQIKRYLD